MKLLKFTLACATIALLSSCNKENQPDQGETSDGTPHYMSVSICFRGGATRAESFEDGLATESKLSSASLFFFNAAGNRSDVCLIGEGGPNARLTNRFDIPNDKLSATLTGTTTDNITASTPVKIIISTKEGEKIPTRLVAICNYPNMGELNGLSYAELKKKLLTAATNAAASNNIIGEGDFIMSNAVYMENTTEMFSTPVTADNICATVEQAEANPVRIYVERVNAKVRGNITAPRPTGNPTYTYNDTAYDIYKIDGRNDLFVAVLGWNVSAVAPYTSLGKDIATDWPTDLLSASEPWNSIDYKRSYWAINPKPIVLPSQAPYNGTDPSQDEMALQHGNFVDAYKRKFDGTNNIAYIYENAATSDGGDHSTGLQYGGSSNKDYEGYTHVIVPAILLKQDGANYVPADICKWLGTEYTMDGLKTAFANQLATELFYEDSGTYKSITPDDLDFITIEDLDSELDTGETLLDYGIPANTYRRYSTWACLSSETGKGKNVQWYDKSIGAASSPAEIETAKMDLKDVNKYLKELMPAQVFKDGLTYYYFDINHLGGKKGVVRNHVYNFTITKISGYGTPVYDPSEVIIPENTEDLASYIAAKIDILSWRVVNQDVALGE